MIKEIRIKMAVSIKATITKESSTLTLRFCPKDITNIELYFSYTQKYSLLSAWTLISGKSSNTNNIGA